MRRFKSLVKSAALRAGYRVERAETELDYPRLDVFDLAVQDCIRKRGEQL